MLKNYERVFWYRSPTHDERRLQVIAICSLQIPKKLAMLKKPTEFGLQENNQAEIDCKRSKCWGPVSRQVDESNLNKFYPNKDFQIKDSRVKDLWKDSIKVRWWDVILSIGAFTDTREMYEKKTTIGKVVQGRA